MEGKKYAIEIQWITVEVKEEIKKYLETTEKSIAHNKGISKSKVYCYKRLSCEKEISQEAT